MFKIYYRIVASTCQPNNILRLLQVLLLAFLLGYDQTGLLTMLVCLDIHCLIFFVGSLSDLEIVIFFLKRASDLEIVSTIHYGFAICVYNK